jgi:hypothetical protein
MAKLMISLEKPIQYTCVPDILRRRIVEIKEKGATAYEIGIEQFSFAFSSLFFFSRIQLRL